MKREGFVINLKINDSLFLFEKECKFVLKMYSANIQTVKNNFQSNNTKQSKLVVRKLAAISQ